MSGEKDEDKAPFGRDLSGAPWNPYARARREAERVPQAGDGGRAVSDKTLGRYLTSWEAIIEYLIELGYSDDEIADDFDQVVVHDSHHQYSESTRSGERIEWSTLHGRRRVLALLATIRGEPAEPVISERPEAAPIPLPTREAVVAKQAELRAAGARHYGYETLAREFSPTSPSTIRRILGKTP